MAFSMVNSLSDIPFNPVNMLLAIPSNEGAAAPALPAGLNPVTGADPSNCCLDGVMYHFGWAVCGMRANLSIQLLLIPKAIA